MGSSTEEAKPRRTKVFVRIAAIIVALAALAGLGAAAVTYERERRADAALGRAADALALAEDDLVAIDAVVKAEITSEIATAAADALALVEGVERQVGEARATIDAARPDLRDASAPLADALAEAADSRADMLKEAPGILEADRRAASVLTTAEDAWRLISDAEGFSQQAAAEFNKHTAAGVRSSTEQSTKASANLASARSALATVTAGFPEADMAPFVAYVDAKEKVLVASREIDALWLAGKIADANAKLAAYNTADQQAVALAKALPTSPLTVIADAYDTLTAEPLERYFAARDRARAADERVRELRAE